MENFSTHLDDELEAIFDTLQQLSARPNSFEEAVTLSGSTSVL